ncbi:hypothetical protein GCM10029963_75630 [Micromonospora andamanensis]|nr:hypothetical protein Vwe01_44970 [Micromonospora andamanensis]
MRASRARCCAGARIHEQAPERLDSGQVRGAEYSVRLDQNCQLAAVAAGLVRDPANVSLQDPGRFTPQAVDPYSLSGVAEWATDLLDTLSAPGEGLAVASENLFPPLTSEIILPLAGFAARRGEMSQRLSFSDG